MILPRLNTETKLSGFKLRVTASNNGSLTSVSEIHSTRKCAIFSYPIIYYRLNKTPI